MSIKKKNMKKNVEQEKPFLFKLKGISTFGKL